MIDPLVQLLLPSEDQATQNDISNYISIEEAIDCRDANSRFFSLLNRESSLNIIISEQSNIVSCKLDTQEIVVDKRLYNETHETWAVGDRPFLKLSNLSWNSHVRGSELVLSSSSPMSNNHPNASNANGNGSSNQHPHTSIYFELTRSNELNCIGKLKTIHLQHQVFYFNLNRATRERAPIDGHTLVIRCNGNLNRIQVQQTRLLCACNKLSGSTGPLAQSLISDIPRELEQSTTVAGSDDSHPSASNLDDVIICDSIYSLESTSALDYLQAQLQFQNRSLVFEVRSMKSTTVPNNNNNVSSSTPNSGAPPTQKGKTSASTSSRQSPNSNFDLKHMNNPTHLRQAFADYSQSHHQRQPAFIDDSIATSSSSGKVSSKTFKQEPQEVAGLSSSTTTSALASSSASYSTSALSQSSEAKQQTSIANKTPSMISAPHPSTILRIRIRITNFGICILPHMMTNYTGTFKFNW